MAPLPRRAGSPGWPIRNFPKVATFWAALARPHDRRPRTRPRLLQAPARVQAAHADRRRRRDRPTRRAQARATSRIRHRRWSASSTRSRSTPSGHTRARVIGADHGHPRSSKRRRRAGRRCVLRRLRRRRRSISSVRSSGRTVQVDIVPRLFDALGPDMHRALGRGPSAARPAACEAAAVLPDDQAHRRHRRRRRCSSS